jgi:excinuclease ABC subunit A
MSEQITIYDAKERNLRILKLELPLHKLLLFEGPSGSGKSSLGIETILAEGQRRCFEALQSALPLASLSPPRPNVGTIEGLPPCFGMKQDISLPFPKTYSLGDLLGIQTLLEQLFLSIGQLHCPKTQEPLSYYSIKEAIDHLFENYSSQASTLLHHIPVTQKNYKGILDELKRNGIARICYKKEEEYHSALLEDAPKQIPSQFFMVLDRVKLRAASKDRLQEAFTKGYQSKEKRIFVLISGNLLLFSREPYSPNLDQFFEVPRRELIQSKNPHGACTKCQGQGEYELNFCSSCKKTGLSEYSSLLRIQGLSFQYILCLPLKKLYDWLASIPTHRFLCEDLQSRLKEILDLELELPLRRRIRTLSTGERSRARLASVLSNHLGTTLYILDEPSLGLDASQVQKVIDKLRQKLKQRHSFIVIDHHPLFSKQADQIFYFGPGSGKHGGTICTETPYYEKIEVDEKSFPKKQLIKTKKMKLKLGGINIITGPSGSGKTRLLYELKDTLSLDFTAIHLLDKLAVQANKRSCVATICELWTPIRSLLTTTRQAKIHGLNASQFSFNRKGGRCESCQGLGIIPFYLPPLPPSESPCPECHGKRFHALVLNVQYRAQNAYQILESTLEDAQKTFEFHPVLANRLKALNLLGLGYLKLGQPTPSLSGGEHRRIQLAKILEPCLHREADLSNTLLLLDDPTAALHPSDAYRIQSCLLELRKADTTVVMTSQNQQMLEIADYILELK